MSITTSVDNDKQLNNKKILVIDDEAQIREMLEKAFRRAGYKVHLASSGEDAMQILEQESIPVMFIDLGLEKMNGFELCEQIRKDRPDAIIYALTGYANLFGIQEIRSVGFDDCFAKPISLNDLYQIVKEAFEKLDKLSETKAIKRILIVDDDDQIRKLLRRMLEHEGYEVTEAADGNEAIELHSAEAFDLIIIDIVMPGKEGIETIIDIKNDDPHAKFIVVSGVQWYGSDAEFEIAKTLGAQVLKKPFKHEALLEAISRVHS